MKRINTKLYQKSCLNFIKHSIISDQEIKLKQYGLNVKPKKTFDKEQKGNSTEPGEGLGYLRNCQYHKYGERLKLAVKWVEYDIFLWDALKKYTGGRTFRCLRNLSMMSISSIYPNGLCLPRGYVSSE